MSRVLLQVLSIVVLAFCLALPAAAEGTKLASHCLAMAEAPRTATVRWVANDPGKLDLSEVRIRFVGHSTFRIESADGVVIATDYAGYAGAGRTPDVVTMNQAHETHYTDTPDPAIPHVLRGWNPEGGPAEHHLSLKDVHIRNVTTDIRTWSNTVLKDGNSIFVFEVAGLCIGHLGHLHHKLAPEDLALIGRLDIVFVPVDGTFTMDQASMTEVVEALKSRLIIPMHYFSSTTLNAFLLGAKENFDVALNAEPEIIVSVESLPERPKVLVLPGY